MKKTLIGIIPLVDRERESYWMLPGYMKGIEEAGGIPVMLPLTSDREALEKLVNYFDGFLFTGGHDVSPVVYREAVFEKCGECCPERDEMEAALLPIILEEDKPALGICRGLQLFNALLGGNLYQDLPAQFPSSVCHRQPAPYDQPAHLVDLIKGTPLQRLLKKDSLPVNSCHHQGIRNLAPGLQPMAYAPDGLVEAVWKPGSRFLWAVQWHPEFSHKVDENSRKIFQDFVKAAAGSSTIRADGPTSIYIKGVTDRDVSPQELEGRAFFKKRKEEIENSITANPHTLDQVIAYIMEKYHGIELSKENRICHQQKGNLKEALIMKHCPRLLEEADLPSLDSILPSDYQDPALQKAFGEKLELRQKKINEIPEALFPMDYHIYEINLPQGQIQIDIEKHWECLGCSVTGDPEEMPHLMNIVKDIKSYYGVTEEDIRTKSERFQDLVITLAS